MKNSGPDSDDPLSYRLPMHVAAVRCFRSSYGLSYFPVCPRCQCTIDREYQRYCDRCGQALEWHNFSAAIVIPPK